MLRGIVAVALLLGAISAPALVRVAHSQGKSIKESLRYSLTDVNGQRHSDAEWRHSKVAVFFFISTECPISNRYAPEMNRIVSDYAAKDISFFAVHSDPGLEAEAARKHAQEVNYTIPVLLDPSESLAASLGVTATPTAVVVASTGGILYRGRIDNRNLDFGKYRTSGIQPDLRLALDAVLTGQPVANPFTRSVGCALPPLEKPARHHYPD
jgi:thiol-disulfide isomerase/thioredoxin